jgi:hypothetical protein
MINEALIKRFFEKFGVGQSNECWNWKASTAGRGYGQIKLPKTRKQIYAHRLSYEIHNGELPDGMMVLHSCDNPRCVNPAHLSLGTGKENLEDMAMKGRHLYGERNTEHKLTEEQVNAIFDLSESGMSQHEISRRFDVGQPQVGRILRGERWLHVYKMRRGNSAPS